MKLGGATFSPVSVVVDPFSGVELKRLWFLWPLYVLADLFLGRSNERDYSGLAFVTTPLTGAGRAFEEGALNEEGVRGAFFGEGAWLRVRKEPFIIAFVADGETMEKRLEELRRFTVVVLAAVKTNAFRAPIALEIDLTHLQRCGVDREGFLEEVREMEKRLLAVGVPVGFKMALQGTDPVTVVELVHRAHFLTLVGAHSSGASISTSNIADFIRRLRGVGLSRIPIIGGGVRDVEDVGKMIAVGADAVRIDDPSRLRPSMLEGIVCAACYFSERG